MRNKYTKRGPSVVERLAWAAVVILCAGLVGACAVGLVSILGGY